jgi:hypothetical protein
MERRTFTSNNQPLPNSPQNFLTETKPTHTRTWFVIAVCVILLFLGIGIFLTLQQEKTKVEQAEKRAAITPTAFPTPTPASPSADFVFYKDLDGEEKFAVAYNFTDSLLGASFAYPPGYSVQSLKADKDQKETFVFFVRDGSKMQAVQQFLTCMRNMTPGGDCEKSILGDVDVTIQPYTSEKAQREYNDADCRMDIGTNNRTIYSCLVGGASDKGMRYILYLSGENPLRLQVFTRDPKTQAHLIRSIISSATNKLN